MNKKNGVSGDALGAEPKKEKQKVLTIEDVKKMVARDLPTCISYLQACMDPDIQDQLSLFLHGKYLNALHREELEAQGELKM